MVRAVEEGLDLAPPVYSKQRCDREVDSELGHGMQYFDLVIHIYILLYIIVYYLSLYIIIYYLYLYILYI